MKEEHLEKYEEDAIEIMPNKEEQNDEQFESVFEPKNTTIENILPVDNDDPISQYYHNELQKLARRKQHLSTTTTTTTTNESTSEQTPLLQTSSEQQKSSTHWLMRCFTGCFTEYCDEEIDYLMDKPIVACGCKNYVCEGTCSGGLVASAAYLPLHSASLSIPGLIGVEAAICFAFSTAPRLLTFLWGEECYNPCTRDADSTASAANEQPHIDTAEMLLEKDDPEEVARRSMLRHPTFSGERKQDHDNQKRYKSI
ncbi:MAG TPA: hypothetical protein VHZ76_02140 [Gammaproteobacteria bacterium]|jgi:hypothetical protein|nr:hypothetical protein [Gammaproteobacteria bacterium]